jgi:hypothetical protein
MKDEGEMVDIFVVSDGWRADPGRRTVDDIILPYTSNDFKMN